jgi:hypothetical protein
MHTLRLNINTPSRWQLLTSNSSTSNTSHCFALEERASGPLRSKRRGKFAGRPVACPRQAKLETCKNAHPETRLRLHFEIQHTL